MTSNAAAAPWTCPFCPLACDHLGVDRGGAALAVRGGDCELARRSLQRFASDPDEPADAERDGRRCDLDSAIAAAARLLAASRQPLFAGLGTDVAGARALYPLACATGAVCDAAGGDALMQGLRALQDRGQFTTTLAEVRTRADVIVFVGGLPGALAPLTRERCGIGEAHPPRRHVVVIGPTADDAATLRGWAGPGVTVEPVALHGDLFTTLALLGALLAQRAPVAAPPALHALADRLRAASYAVWIGTPARLPPHGALIIEAVHRAVGELNRRTRAAALWVGGGNGGATANQVFTWLSGLPLRSRAGPYGLEHEPTLFDAHRLLADRGADALLWVSSFDADALPPANHLPMVVLGPPAMAPACRRAGPTTLFIPVATPGVGCDGHVFRTDGTVLMPLIAARRDGLPTVADVAQRMLRALHSASAA
jgi:formylmethanofuran dehydrogenase subunit B